MCAAEIFTYTFFYIYSNGSLALRCISVINYKRGARCVGPTAPLDAIATERN